MIENFKSKKITGVKIRTNNNSVDEIVSLWKKVLDFELSGNIFAVYYNYESDYNGNYDFLIGSSNNDLSDYVNIEEGKYSVWQAEDSTPEAVGAIWHKIWNTKLDRKYGTDFEIYSQDGSVKIYIGIK